MQPACRLLRAVFFITAAQPFITASTQWPAGTYGLPRAISGCPSSKGFTWRTGWRYQDTEDFLPSNKHSSNFHLDASVSSSNLKRTFCMKTNTAGDTSRPKWPKGKYCIYKKGSCPPGLKSGYITWDDEDWFNKNNKGGVLPDGVYNKNTKIFYCCKTDGNKTQPITLPTSKPFFLVAYESASCQQVNWAVTSTEWIRFDTEKDSDGYGGAYPYGAGLNDHTIHYCYYTSCNYTLTTSTGSFQSPNYPAPYPAGQYCSWKIKVPQGLQVRLKFPNFALQGGSNTDNVQLYDGQNETLPSLGVYSGDSLPPKSGIQSSSNVLFVIFKSDSKNSLTGFQATYTAQVPTLPPLTIASTTVASTTQIQTTTTNRVPTTTSVRTTTASKPSQNETSSSTSATTNAKTTVTRAQTSAPTSVTVPITVHYKTTARTTTTTATATTTTNKNTHGNTTTTATAATTNNNTHRNTTTTAETTTNKKTHGNTTTTESATRSMPPTPEVTSVPSKRPTEVTTKEEEPVTETTGKTEQTKPTEQEKSTIWQEGGNSSYSHRKIEQDSGSDNTALIVVPLLCVTLLVAVLLILLYYRRNRRRRENQKQIVYYDSNPALDSINNPLYDSGVNVAFEPMKTDPVYSGGTSTAMNPLYETQKTQITDFLLEPGEKDRTVINLKSSEVMECSNPLYEESHRPDESSA